MKTGSLIVGWLHPGDWSASFGRSLFRLWPYDATHNQRLVGIIDEECGAGRITDGRNTVVQRFLSLDAEWLAFVDADMGFEADTFDRLIEAADPKERPIVGALAFAQRKGPATQAAARRFEMIPTLYRWVDSKTVAGVAPMYDYPRDQMVQVDATGAACFVVHRTVLEKLAEVFPAPRMWFDETIYKGNVYGEDITFFRRCAEQGFPIYVHTGVKTSHYKPTYLDEEAYGSPVEDTPTFVVVPVKGRMDLTRNLLTQLSQQGGYDGIFVYDNGSPQKAANELRTWHGKHKIEVFDADGLNIHQMWNRGLEEACKRGWPCNVAILNNDISIGDDFLGRLSKALRGEPNLGAVCPNYDGRPGAGIQPVEDICAGRYDGSGGFAGFAFMLKGEAGYRFPEELSWWFGDTDLVASIVTAGSRAAIVLDATCEHVDGGGQTADWDDPEMKKVLEADREVFEAKWSRIKQPA